MPDDDDESVEHWERYLESGGNALHVPQEIMAKIMAKGEADEKAAKEDLGFWLEEDNRR